MRYKSYKKNGTHQRIFPFKGNKANNQDDRIEEDTDQEPNVYHLPQQSILPLKGRINVYHLSRLDSIAQTFQCGFTVSLIAVGYAGTEIEDFLINKGYDVKLDVLNRYDAEKPTLIDSRIEKKNIILVYQCEGTFSEMYELANFPFDCQVLHLCLTLNNAVLKDGNLNEEFQLPLDLKGIVLDKLSTDDCAVIQNGAFYDSNMWWLQYKPDIRGPILSHISNSGTRKQYSILEVAIHLKREPASYIYNIILPSFFITTLAFTSWFLPIDDLTSRNQITLSLMLSAIAYKFVVSEKIPPVGYMTVLDIYVLGCGLFLGLIYVENFFASVMNEFADNVMFIALGILWFCFNCYAFIAMVNIKRKISQSARFTKRYEVDDSKRGIPWKISSFS